MKYTLKELEKVRKNNPHSVIKEALVGVVFRRRKMINLIVRSYISFFAGLYKALMNVIGNFVKIDKDSNEIYSKIGKIVKAFEDKFSYSEIKGLNNEDLNIEDLKKPYIMKPFTESFSDLIGAEAYNYVKIFISRIEGVLPNRSDLPFLNNEIIKKLTNEKYSYPEIQEMEETISDVKNFFKEKDKILVGKTRAILEFLWTSLVKELEVQEEKLGKRIREMNWKKFVFYHFKSQGFLNNLLAGFVGFIIKPLLEYFVKLTLFFKTEMTIYVYRVIIFEALWNFFRTLKKIADKKEKAINPDLINEYRKHIRNILIYYDYLSQTLSRYVIKISLETLIESYEQNLKSNFKNFYKQMETSLKENTKPGPGDPYHNIFGDIKIFNKKSKSDKKQSKKTNENTGSDGKNNTNPSVKIPIILLKAEEKLLEKINGKSSEESLKELKSLESIFNNLLNVYSSELLFGTNISKKVLSRVPETLLLHGAPEDIKKIITHVGIKEDKIASNPEFFVKKTNKSSNNKSKSTGKNQGRNNNPSSTPKEEGDSSNTIKADNEVPNETQTEPTGEKKTN